MNKYVFIIQAALDVHVAACKRFGADKAELAIGATRDAINAGKNAIGIIEDVRFEAGVEITDADIEFVKWIISADCAVAAAIQYLKEAKECPVNQ